MMSNIENSGRKDNRGSSGRRGFFFAAAGGVVAAFAGWLAGAFPRQAHFPQGEASTPVATLPEATISALETKVETLADQLADQAAATRPIPQLAQLEGDSGERVVFNKSELTVTNPQGVLLNLVATNGHVGIRFYKDFDFGNEQVTNPWHMGYIEGVEGYEGLAILRDWRFTAALWGEDGRLLLGSLHPHPPANVPANARVHVRGTLDEVQTIVEGSPSQRSDIFQVLDGQGSKDLAVDHAGNLMVGSAQHPNAVILYDTESGDAYSLNVTNGQLSLSRA